jgi:DNA topoisomerase-1
MSSKEKSLVIVESPSKAKTIKKYLGSGFEVEASVGHIIDLPKSKFGVNIEDGFKPQYIKIRGKEKVIKQLKTHAQNVSMVYLATDPLIWQKFTRNKPDGYLTVLLDMKLVLYYGRLFIGD